MNNIPLFSILNNNFFFDKTFRLINFLFENSIFQLYFFKKKTIYKLENIQKVNPN